jgi:hypothetical protein
MAFAAVPTAAANIYFTEYLNNTNGEESTYEWCEIYNAGNKAIDLTGWSFADNTSGGVINTFGVIEAGAFMIIAKDAQAWVSAWGLGQVGSTVHEWTGGNLSNTADSLSLFNAQGAMKAHLSYSDGETAGSSIYFSGDFGAYLTEATYQDELNGWFHSTRPTYDTSGNVRSGGIDIGNPFAGSFAVPSPGALALLTLAPCIGTGRRRSST